MRKCLLAIAVLILVPISASYAEIYSWTDRDGISHLSDDITKVPAEYQSQAKSRRIQDDPEYSGSQGTEEPAAAMRYRERAEYSEQSGAEETDRYGRGENYWHDRAEQLREQLISLQDDYEAVITQERACESKPFDFRGKRPDCSRFGYMKSHIERANDRIRKALDVDLPDEARKAGARPGWLR